MKKFLITACLISTVLANSAYAQRINSATVSLTGKQVSAKSTNNLSLTVEVTLNAKPKKDCDVTINASVSEVGVEDSASRRRKIATKTVGKGDSKLVKFSYTGPAIKGVQGEESQINVQATVKCKNENSFKSSIDATNITCTNGVESKDFLKTFAAKIR